MQKLVILLLACFMAVACSDARTRNAVSLQKALKKETGHQHNIVKLQSNYPDYVIYQDTVTGEFMAYNVTKWDGKQVKTYEQYRAVATLDLDIIGNLELFRENGQIVYRDNGRIFTFENTSVLSRDLDTIAALKEEAAQQFVAMRLSSEYSLSSARAAELAKLATRYQRLENVRELTASEKDRFALQALGVSFSQVESAVKNKAQGNETAYTDLLNTAARVNGTTPEQIGKIFSDMEIVID